ncbi:MAG: esterase/lipase family protein [Bdellovibrionales bacterium]
MAKPVVFFIRGLSTYGRDTAKWSVFDFGPVYKNLALALSREEIEFYPVVGLGAGSLSVIADRAVEFLKQHPVWNDTTREVHLLGQSAGGLVLRLALPKLNRRPRSAVTIASPHRGSRLAEICTSMPVENPGTAKFLRAFGYDVDERIHLFSELAPSGLSAIFGYDVTSTEPEAALGKHLEINSLSLASIVCHTPSRHWCWPIWTMHRLPAFKNFARESDGFIERHSQPFGQVLAEIGIDHFRQMGMFKPGRHFHELISVLSRHFHSFSDNPR